MKYIIFDENSNPVSVEGQLHDNGLELSNGIFLKMDNVHKLVFSDVILAKIIGLEADNMHLTELYREESYATTSTNQEMVAESIDFLSNKIDSVIIRIDGAVGKIKNAKDNPEEIIKLLQEFKTLADANIQESLTFSVTELKESALKIPVRLGNKGKITLNSFMDTGSQKVLISDSLVNKYPELAEKTGNLLKVQGITSGDLYAKTINFPITVAGHTFNVNAGVIPDLEGKIGLPLMTNIEIFNCLKDKGFIKVNIPN